MKKYWLGVLVVGLVFVISVGSFAEVPDITVVDPADDPIELNAGCTKKDTAGKCQTTGCILSGGGVGQCQPDCSCKSAGQTESEDLSE